MPTHQVATLLLTVACCLTGRLGWAQRTAVAPLAPLAPVEVRPASPNTQLQGVQLNSSPTRPAPVPSAAAAAEQRIWPQPVYLLNSCIITGPGLRDINPQDIAKINVYKGPNVPVQWRSLTENGLINITMKPGVKLKFKIKSLNALRRQVRVTGLVSFRLNGMRIEDASLRVATVAIAGLDILHDDSETIINIRLAPPKPSPLLPGIYIRGTASR